MARTMLELYNNLEKASAQEYDFKDSKIFIDLIPIIIEIVRYEIYRKWENFTDVPTVDKKR